ncbi:uncharacterized protein LOC133797792 [Humulus lupulus]|uniref:uncharacterized protein LOC133797792 n=1 Tax=Humulus lupulus TaxID=3486 RepID=UPI002B4103CA|nr:uncharacterized protein LOC133797792 [Humulus lupulus]
MSNNISAVVVAIIISFLPLILLLNQLRRLWDSVDFGSRSQPENRPSQHETQTQIILKLVIDKNRKQVVFVECDNEFVDVLLSFLTLPMGTIIRVADNKKSGIGSMDKLYKSVEAMNRKCFWTKACKSMLLEPRSAYGLRLNNLAVKIDGIDYTKFYTCSKTPCLNYESLAFVSFLRNSICACGKTMDNYLRMKYADGNDYGSFISRAKRFIISDDLQVLPASISNARLLFLRQGITDNNSVDEWKINVGIQEVLQLLHRSLLSKTPFTDAFLPKAHQNMDIILSPNSSLHTSWLYQYLLLNNSSSSQQEMNVKLWFSKSTKRVICIEAEEDFVDFLFSFLTIPLGSVIKLFKGNSLLGSIDNLYKSVQESNAISTRCKEMLLSPKIERMFGCESQLLEVNEEVTPAEFAYNKCYACCLQNKTACCHTQNQRLKIMNPKCPGSTKTGGGFVREQGCYLVTDSLEVELLSPASGMSRLEIPFSDLEELPIAVGREEALAILKAAMTTRSVLTQAFSPIVNNFSNLYLNNYSRV